MGNDETQVGTDSDWTLISAGQLHSMALKSNGSLFGMGSNLSGQIGLGTVPNASVMTLVSAETNWIDVSAGSLFSVLRRNDGLVRSTGDNSQGQLGNRSTDSRTGFGDASFGLPDLTISAVAIATADPAPGTSITVNVFLLNEGSAAVPASSNLMVNLRLSLDTVYNSLDDSLLGTFTFNGAVGSGRGTTVAGNIDLPAEFDVGDFFVVARVDIGGALRELSETNNTGSSVVTISYFPDLSGSFANIDPGMGSQVNRGQPLNFDFVVTNSGNARIPEDPEGVFTLNVFLSEDQFLGADDLALIENQSIADAFAASQTRSFAQMVMIPLFTPLGSYFLIGQIDTGTPQLPELDLENNIIITAIPEVEVIGITITEAVDDPVAELEDDQGQIVRTDIEFSTGGAGQWFGQTVEFQRDGDAAQSPPLEAGEQSFVEAVVPGPSAVTFKWKVSSQRIENFLQITIDGAEPILDGRISGDVDWIQVTHILPANTNQLRWTYVQGADGDGTETAYLDDVTVADLTGSDLVIESVSFRAGIYVPQRDILGLTVLGRNQGEEAQLTNLPSVFMVDVFLSLDRLVGNDDDIFIGTLVRFQDLDPDDRFGYRATRPIPGDTAPGQYFVAVIVDSTNVIPEFNESNNAFLSETADVTIEPRPDLVPLAVSFNPFFPDPESDDFPGFFLQSEIIELTFTIQNVGLADAPADPFNINIVLSNDREIGDSTDAILLTLPEISGLPVGQTRTYNLTVEIPPRNAHRRVFLTGNCGRFRQRHCGIRRRKQFPGVG